MRAITVFFSYFIEGVTVAFFAAIMCNTSWAKPIFDVAGNWNMIHDDWRGTLVIYQPSGFYQYVEPWTQCNYGYYGFTGTYTGNDGIARTVRGTFGGKDENMQNGSTCKQSDHLIKFTIAFPNTTPQSFVGYLFTHQRRTMAGYTWWQGIPFGWSANKP